MKKQSYTQNHRKISKQLKDSSFNNPATAKSYTTNKAPTISNRSHTPPSNQQMGSKPYMKMNGKSSLKIIDNHKETIDKNKNILRDRKPSLNLKEKDGFI